MKESPDDLLAKLHGVTGPELTAPLPPSPLTWWIAVSLVTLLLIGIVLFWRRRGLRLSVPADVEAFASLRKLPSEPTAMSLTALDHLMRRYLGRVLHTPTMRLTTPELLAALPVKEWAYVFEPCDRARFAGALPTQTAWSELLRRAAMLIQADCERVAGGFDGARGIKPRP